MTYGRLQRFISFLGHHSDAMPCDDPDDEIDLFKLPDPKLWAKRGRVNSDQNGEEEEDTDEDKIDGRRRKWNGKAEYVMIKKWVTGDCATMEDSDIMTELNDLARDYMELSRLKRLPNHKANPTDIGLWKLARSHFKAKTGVTNKVYRCAMHYRCGCNATIRVTNGNDYITLERGGTHDENSHSDDKSVFLKHKQIEAISDAIAIAPFSSAATIRRNLLMLPKEGCSIGTNKLRSIDYHARMARVRLTTEQLSGFEIEDTYGSYLRYAERFSFRRLADQHNDPLHDFHFDLYDPVVIGYDVKAHRNLLYLSISSPWFLMNIFRSYATGWATQLNGDATFKFCRVDVDMIGLGVNSIGGHNNPLVWSIIPHGSEGAITYDRTFNDLQDAAIILIKSITCCENPDCAFCSALIKLREDAEVTKYMKSDEYGSAKLHIDTAQCDNHLGWQKFAREILGIIANICKNHVLGNDCVLLRKC